MPKAKSRIIHIGRNKVAQRVAGTSQPQPLDVALCPRSDQRKATVVPEVAAFARSGLGFHESSGLQLAQMQALLENDISLLVTDLQTDQWISIPVNYEHAEVGFKVR